MSYRAKVNDIRQAHYNAWDALFESIYSGHSIEETERLYYEKYHAKLIYGKSHFGQIVNYEFIEFESESDYVMYMLEWS